MNRSPRLNDLWPYLPAFRVVAETEHLPSAAALLHVVPSALSRSVRLLEEALGEPLFTRTGRRIVLNPRGRALLEAVRAAERALDRGVHRAADQELEGEYRVSTLGVLPDIVAAPHLGAGRLRRFSFELVPPVEVYGACREGEEEGLAGRLFQAVSARLAASSRTRRRPR